MILILSLLAAPRTEGSAISLWWLIGTAITISLVWIGVFYGDRIRKAIHERAEPPANLFLNLCEAHQLDRGERDYLSRLAASARLSRPGVLFVDPSHLRRSAAAGGPDAKTAEILLKKLFNATPA